MDASFSYECKDSLKKKLEIFRITMPLSIFHINSSNLVPFGRRHKLWDTFYGPQQDIWQSLFVKNQKFLLFFCISTVLVFSTLNVVWKNTLAPSRYSITQRFVLPAQWYFAEASLWICCSAYSRFVGWLIWALCLIHAEFASKHIFQLHFKNNFDYDHIFRVSLKLA